MFVCAYASIAPRSTCVATEKHLRTLFTNYIFIKPTFLLKHFLDAREHFLLAHLDPTALINYMCRQIPEMKDTIAQVPCMASAI